MGDLRLEEMGEHRPRVDERERAGRSGKRDVFALPVRIEPTIVGIVVLETEARRARRQVFAAPLDHASMDIDPQIGSRRGILPNQLPRNAAAAAAEVQHRVVRFYGHVLNHQASGRVVE